MGNKALNSLARETPIAACRFVIRKIRRFNVIPRTEKRIDQMVKGKPQRAPLFDVTLREIEKFLNENPDGLTKFSEKDAKLEKNLENVYVTSAGDNKDGFSVARVDPSWEKRFALQNVSEATVPPGKYTIKRAREFLFAYNKDPKEFSAPVLSEMYGINPESMEKILDHVKVFRVVMPQYEAVKQPLYMKYAQGMIPTEMVEEPTADKFFQEATVRQKNLMNPFHAKLQRPTFEQVEAKKDTVRKAIERTALHLLMLPKDTRALIENDPRLRRFNPPEQEFDANETLKKAEEMRTGEPTSVMEQSVSNPLPEIVKPEDEFDVFKAVESMETDDKSKESKTGQPPLKASEKV